MARRRQAGQLRVNLAEEAAERRRFEQEVALARRIQVALLPAEMPQIPGLEIHGGNIPSRGVSGDYYQIVERGHGEVAVVVADVSGKGIAASLLTASLEALVAGPIHDGIDPATICRRVSHLLYDRTPPEKFATGFLAYFDPGTARLHYCNAGHNPGIVMRSGGEVEKLASTGLPLGMMPSGVYLAAEVHLGAGDTVVLYTDGITEAIRPKNRRSRHRPRHPTAPSAQCVQSWHTPCPASDATLRT